MTALAESAKAPSGRGSDFFITPRVPQGLASAVESLTREIIRHRPEDIYVFAADHFEKLLRLRQEHNPINRKLNDNLDLMESTVVSIQDPYLKPYTNIFKDSMIISLPPKSQKYKQRQSERQVVDAEMKSPPMIIAGMQTKDIKTELRKNRLSSREKHDNHTKSKIATNLNIEKVKDEIIKKFATSTSSEELQRINYAPKVQTIIDNTVPIIHNKLEMLKKNSRINENIQDHDFSNSNRALEAQLSETCNLLKDISSCFSKPMRRPRSADSATNIKYRSTDGLEAMLNETHNLLVGISSNFFKQNSPHRPIRNEDNGSGDNSNTSSLPAVKSPVSTTMTKNITKSDSSTFALPPVIIGNSTIDTPKSVKTKQNLTLPELAARHESKDNGDTMSIATKVVDEEISDTVIGVDEEVHEKKSIYVLTDENSPSEIPGEVITVIIPDKVIAKLDLDKIDSPGDGDPLDSFGEIVTPLPDDLVMEPLLELAESKRNNKLKLPKHDLQCINEEEVSEDHEQDYRAEKIAVDTVESVKIGPKSNPELYTESDESEHTSSAKETSATDGQIESSKNFRHAETALSSPSTDVAESSNEAKETTLTDGISFSLDDPTRPFVPELNLDSLQDLTISSFKMTEDEYEQADDNENTNSVTESSTVSLCHQTGQDEDTMMMVVGDSCQDEELTKSKIDSTQATSVDSTYEPLKIELDSYAEEEMPLTVSRSASQCTTRRVSSGNLAWVKENKETIVDENDEMKVFNEDHSSSDTEKKEGKEETKISMTTTPRNTETDCDSPDDGSSIIDVEDEKNLNLISAVILIQAGVRGFLARRRHRLERTSQQGQATDRSSIPSLIEEYVIAINDESEESTSMERQPELYKTMLQDNTIIEMPVSDSQSYKLKKRLYRENAMQQNTTMSTERLSTDVSNTVDNGLQHTGEFHDCIPLPLFDATVQKSNGDADKCLLNKEEGRQQVINSSEVWTLMKLNDENDDHNAEIMISDCDGMALPHSSKTSLGVSVFQLNSGITGILNLLLLNNEKNPIQDAYGTTTIIAPPSRSPSRGVVIQEIQNTEDININAPDEDLGESRVEIHGTDEKEIKDRSLSSPSISIPSAPDVSMSAVQVPLRAMSNYFPLSSKRQDTLIRYGSEDFPTLDRHLSIPDIPQALIIHDALHSSLSLSQENLSLLLGDERIESPITMMQIVPLKSESINSNNDGKKDEENSSESLLHSQSTSTEEQIKLDADNDDN